MDENISMNEASVNEYFVSSVRDLTAALENVEYIDLNLCGDVLDALRNLCYVIANLRREDGQALENAAENIERLEVCYYSITFGLFAQGHYSRADAQKMTRVFLEAFPELETTDQDVRELFFKDDHDFTHENTMYWKNHEKSGFSPTARAALILPEFTSSLDTHDYIALMDHFDGIYLSCGVWDRVQEYLSMSTNYTFSQEDVGTLLMLGKFLSTGVITVEGLDLLEKNLIPVRTGFQEAFWLPVYRYLDNVDAAKALVQLILHFHQDKTYPKIDSEELLALLSEKITAQLTPSLLASLVVVPPEQPKSAADHLANLYQHYS